MSVADKTYDLMLKVQVTGEFVGDVLVTAFDGWEGACWDWCSPAGRFAFESEDDVWTAVHIKIDEPESDKEGEPIKVDAPRLLAGMQVLAFDPNLAPDLAEHLRRAMAENDAGEIDAYLATCIVQQACLGEIRFS